MAARKNVKLRRTRTDLHSQRQGIEISFCSVTPKERLIAHRFSRGKLPFPDENIKRIHVMSVTAPKYLWRVLAISAALVFAYATVLRKLGLDWWSDENYSHGLLIPFIIGYILWTNRQRFRLVAPNPSLFWGGAAVLFEPLTLWGGRGGAELYSHRISPGRSWAGLLLYPRGC